MKPYPYYPTRGVTTVKDVVSYRNEHTPEKDAFRVRVDKGRYRAVSWRQFKHDIDALGTALFAQGLKGAHICVIGENSYEWILAYMTALSGAGVIVPLDKELPADQIRHFIGFADARAVVFSQTYEPMMREISPSLPGVTHWISMAGETRFTPLSGLLAQGAELLRGGDDTFSSLTPDTKGMAALYFTSGTSGLAKGVMLSQKNMVASFDGAARHISYNDDDVFLSVLPLHHCYESNCGILAMLHSGAVICFNETLKHFTANLRLFRPTGMSLVPLVADTLLRQIMDKAQKSGKVKKLKTGMKISDFLLKLNIDLTGKLFGEVHEALGGRFKKAFVGGAPMNPAVTRAFRQLGVMMLQGYGITECSPLVSVNREQFHKEDSVGPVLPVCRVRIEHGEVQVKGDNVMLGYYKNEEATAAAFTKDGWFKTGDLGYIDKDGFLYITGREKNLIILDSGENICPEELEGYLVSLPLVSEVVVYQEDGKITAEIYPDGEAAAQQGIGDVHAALAAQVGEINRGLPRYKHITAVKLRDGEFEKTTTKKIMRYKVIPDENWHKAIGGS